MSGSELSQHNGHILTTVSGMSPSLQSHRFQVKDRQSGQAALEAMISALALVVLWVAIAWLGRIQDIALHANHAARFSAFMGSRDDTIPLADQVRTGFFSGSGNRWIDLRGELLQKSVYQTIDVTLARGNAVTPEAQVGGSDPDSTQLRQDWGLADPGVLSAQISLAPRHTDGPSADDHSLLKLAQFDAAYPEIARHVSIMTGAGHSGSDTLAATRIARSALGWSDPTEVSVRQGRRVAFVASNVDAAWNRPDPVFDWLGPWADRVPDHHLLENP